MPNILLNSGGTIVKPSQQQHHHQQQQQNHYQQLQLRPPATRPLQKRQSSSSLSKNSQKSLSSSSLSSLSASNFLFANNVSTLLQTPFAEYLLAETRDPRLKYRLNTHFTDFGFLVISLKAVVVVDASQQQHIREFFVSNRNINQVQNMVTVAATAILLPLLRCRFYEMDEQLLDLEEQQNYRFVGMLKKTDTNDAVEKFSYGGSDCGGGAKKKNFSNAHNSFEDYNDAFDRKNIFNSHDFGISAEFVDGVGGGGGGGGQQREQQQQQQQEDYGGGTSPNRKKQKTNTGGFGFSSENNGGGSGGGGNVPDINFFKNDHVNQEQEYEIVQGLVLQCFAVPTRLQYFDY
ncbi:hypothetical protein HK100_007568 [Physocladia obscura]|uniref:Uncharacterized protein n=1 Tax=Physocladia obscura TaxID=109957 RepID=A0AAD5XIN3_9FUNG|nr:hypothetical protein HK100_007568 [Physocladia obscura]